MTNLTLVRFKRKYAPYNEGELAGLPHEKALALLKRGTIELIQEEHAEKPETEAPSLQRRDIRRAPRDKMIRTKISKGARGGRKR